MSEPMTGHPSELDAACLAAHGGPADHGEARRLVAVFAGPVAHELLLIGARLGYAIALIDPDRSRLDQATRAIPGLDAAAGVRGLAPLDAAADVVLTDHHRGELGKILRDLLATDARWIGLMGNPRHEGPHVAALQGLGVAQADIDRVRRPIGLNIGSKTPAEIAVSTLAGLLADRAGRPGGFTFP